MTAPGQWDDYLAGAESSGYVTGDVAATWNAYAAHSDASLDNAADAIEANDAALYDAASHIGTDPAAFNAAAAQAEAAFDATFQNQLASIGVAPGIEVAGANDSEVGADPFDHSHYDSQVDGF